MLLAEFLKNLRKDRAHNRIAGGDSKCPLQLEVFSFKSKRQVAYGSSHYFSSTQQFLTGFSQRIACGKPIENS
ncbi:hypothetical protein D3C80_1262450 [compost metagenome]